VGELRLTLKQWQQEAPFRVYLIVQR
jgi:hypothetical protein